jgi:hypothetical protein
MRIGIALALAAAFCLVVFARWGRWTAPFDEPHGWVEAHHATMARDFATGGLLEHGILPTQNLPPQGNQLDGYNHWPPLFPMVLAAWWTVTGEGEFQARLLMLAVLLTGAWGITRLATLAGARHGWIAAVMWLAIPLQITFGVKLIHLQAALVAGIWSFVLHLSGRRRWAMVAAGIATAFSWEPGLAFGCAFLFAPRAERRAWFNLAAAAGAVFVGVLALYAWTRPDLLGNLISALKLRSGLDPSVQHHTDLHSFWDGVASSRPISWSESLSSCFARAVGGLGLPMMALVAVAPLAARSLPRVMRTVTLAWFGAFVGWNMMMRDHAFWHSYEMQLCLPFVALAVAGSLSAPRLPRAAPALAAVLILSYGGYSSVQQRQLSDMDAAKVEVQVGREIEAHVPAGSIVMLPGRSMLPLWYTQRHAFRSVRTPKAFEAALISYREFYSEPRPALWIALTHGDHPVKDTDPSLAAMFAERTPDYESENVTIYRLAP